MKSFRIFIVENDDFYGPMLKHFLEKNPDYEVHLFTNGKDCLKHLFLQPSLITLEYTLPDLSGLELLHKLKCNDQFVPIVIVSEQNSISTAIDLLHSGAYGYIEKNNQTTQRLWQLIQQIQKEEPLTPNNFIHAPNDKHAFPFQSTIKGNSKALKTVFEKMNKVINNKITISIHGETGTGKELVAKALHDHSSRRNHAFIPVNISAIPESLIESEMFGYEKGAFTDAKNKRLGIFEQAHKGTLFLDEITEMSLNMQSKLLRVLQDKSFFRIGGSQMIRSDFRLIVASNKNLLEEVNKGQFRKDLYYRLLGMPIELPPLRDRGKDIAILARHFIREFCKENNLSPKSISQDAIDKLMSYEYPGNIRELKAIVELSVVMTNHAEIQASDISFGQSPSLKDFIEEEMSLATYQKRIIRYYLDKYNSNVVLVAKKLGIGKSTLYRMLKNQEIKQN